MSSCVASCCMCCPAAFIASATMVCSPMPAARLISRPPVSYCISPRPCLLPTRAITALQAAAFDPPSYADTAVPRCSSSRPSHALSAFVDLRAHRVRHDSSTLDHTKPRCPHFIKQCWTQCLLLWPPKTQRYGRHERQYTGRQRHAVATSLRHHRSVCCRHPACIRQRAAIKSP